jgi:DNA-binding winged helix-turn-helix (wHTH) protein
VSAETQQPVAFGTFRLDRRGRSLTRAGAEIPLARRAFDVLCVLAAAGGETVSKDALFDQVWSGLTVEENNLQVQISALRKALGDGMIATIPGRGYRLTMAAPSERPPMLDATAGKPSIAVLPFTNMSGDIEQEYFADGVADDIITELACVRSLFVIARNSSFAYKGRAVDERQIARELGVRYVLEGSVRRGAAARHGPTRGRGDWQSPVGQPI